MAAVATYAPSPLAEAERRMLLDAWSVLAGHAGVALCGGASDGRKP